MTTSARPAFLDKIEPQVADGELVKVADAENEPEAELLQSILLEGGVPSVLRRPRGFDGPDFLAGPLFAQSASEATLGTALARRPQRKSQPRRVTRSLLMREQA